MSASALGPQALAAHTPRPGTDEWDDLAKHLAKVAKRTACFAAAFGGEGHGLLVGLYHDLGKCNPKFQDYLWECHKAELSGSKPPRKKVPHSIWGAAYAYRIMSSKGPGRWAELALPIKGHHSALADQGDAELTLVDFIAKHPHALRDMQTVFVGAKDLLENKNLTLRALSREPTEREFFMRMLFSALIDADRLISEEFSHPDQASLRKDLPSLEELSHSLASSLPSTVEQSPDLKRIRDEVYTACKAAASKPPGLFRLTVPTGGGKTRSVLAFALEHARRYDLDRVVVALPYTSIIDQTARVYRGFLGEDAVLEHHSALEIADEEGEDEQALRRRLATENWDARLIVTTTVQLFESLFANRASRVRKLHRLAKSVIILDEIQAFPAQLLRPTLDVIRLLVTPIERGGYGATVVLSTATQPAFEIGPLAELLRGIEPPELVPNYKEYYETLRRVKYHWRREPQTWSELASEIRDLKQVMVIVNTRKDALALLDALGNKEEVFHLSTLLCGAHRRAVLQRVKELLEQGRKVKLISTQVVECGVDLDFPVVYRAIGPLDRIVQAAGRCNRNGRLECGDVIIFVPAEGASPKGPYKIGSEKARLLLETRDAEELHYPAIYREYFSMLHRDVDAGGGLDKYRIQEKRQVFNFPMVAKHYRLIDSDTVPVIVPYGIEWRWRLEDWTHRPSRRHWRRLHPYLVNLFEHELKQRQDWLEPVGDKLDHQLYQWTGDYDTVRHRGMVDGFTDPADLYI